MGRTGAGGRGAAVPPPLPPEGVLGVRCGAIILGGGGCGGRFSTSARRLAAGVDPSDAGGVAEGGVVPPPGPLLPVAAGVAADGEGGDAPAVPVEPAEGVAPVRPAPGDGLAAGGVRPAEGPAGDAARPVPLAARLEGRVGGRPVTFRFRIVPLLLVGSGGTTLVGIAPATGMVPAAGGGGVTAAAASLLVTGDGGCEVV